MDDIRLALCGASGTGKTTLSQFVEKEYGVPFNPVGSRSVSKAMGFDSPYDVDKAGKRAEFQRRLVTEKCKWESERESFVTDRTTLDNLAYTMLHDVKSIDEDLLVEVVSGLQRYTHIIYCPTKVFCNPGSDPSRLADLTYHKLFDIVIYGLVDRYLHPFIPFHTMEVEGIEHRQDAVRDFLSTHGPRP